MAIAPSSEAFNEESAPRYAPIGVRVAETMKTGSEGIFHSWGSLSHPPIASATAGDAPRDSRWRRRCPYSSKLPSMLPRRLTVLGAAFVAIAAIAAACDDDLSDTVETPDAGAPLGSLG